MTGIGTIASLDRVALAPVRFEKLFETPFETMNEPELVARLRQGDEQAFEILVKRYGARLLAVARRFLRDEEEARDALQDALLSAFRSFGSFKSESRISTWLHRIVVNVALMRLRTRRRKPESPIDPLLPSFADDGHHAQRVLAWRGTAETELERKETCALVRASVDRLPESYRTVLVLRDFEELDTEETARLLGISVTAAKIRLHRARQALRAQLAPYFESGAPARRQAGYRSGRPQGVVS